MCSLRLFADAGYQGPFGNLSQGSRTWEHGGAPHFALPPSWPYRMPQNFLPQGNGGFQPNKPYLSQGESYRREQLAPQLLP